MRYIHYTFISNVKYIEDYRRVITMIKEHYLFYRMHSLIHHGRKI